MKHDDGIPEITPVEALAAVHARIKAIGPLFSDAPEKRPKIMEPHPCLDCPTIIGPKCERCEECRRKRNLAYKHRKYMEYKAKKEAKS